MQPPNPSYQGKRLSQWLEELPETRNPVLPLKTIEAIQTMGETAIPFLLRELSATDSRLDRKLDEMRQRYFNSVVHLYLWRQERAKSAMLALGDSAKTAIPELEKLLENEDSAENAAIILLHLPPEGIVVFRKAMAHPQAEVRGAVTSVLYAPVGTNYAREFLPELLQQLNDPSLYVRHAAIRAIENIAEQREIIIPALIKCLEHPVPDISATAGEALDKFGTNILVYSNQIVKLILDGKLPADWAPKLITNTDPVLPASERYNLFPK